MHPSTESEADMIARFVHPKFATSPSRYTGTARSGKTFAIIVGAHVALLTAVALGRMDLPAPPIFKRLETRNIPLPPPPEPKRVEKIVERPVELPRPRDTVTVVDPIIATPNDAPIAANPNDAIPFPSLPRGDAVIPMPDAVPDPGQPPLPKMAAIGIRPRGDPSAWVTNDDYPQSALRSEEEGLTRVRLDVSPEGRPTACTVTGPSGVAALDRTACTLLMRRARFVPGRDTSGKPAGGAYSKSFRWQIPD